jgi:hypothetical protein
MKSVKHKPVDRNLLRRKRYASDPEHREHVVSTKRERYRKHRVELGAGRINCLERLPHVRVYGNTREIATSEGPLKLLTFNTSEVGALLGYHPVVMRGWQSKRKFPRGGYASTDKIPVAVFTEPQVREFMKIMGEHQRTSYFLYDKNTSVIRALFAVMKPHKHTPHEKQKNQTRGSQGNGFSAQPHKAKRQHHRYT